MNESFVARSALPDFILWQKLKLQRTLVSFDLEVTTRCNNNCRHCYINVAANNVSAKERELSLDDIKRITDQAVSLGAFWCLITGGEPLIRKDFFDIYLYLKRKGLLVSVFTNATLITKEHVTFFKRYPPRDIEVTVYGATKGVYERITRKPGSYVHFIRGLTLLLESGIKVRLKAMALRSNLHELSEISRFCKSHTKDYFRFDPFLHLRFDGDKKRNREIKSERLSAAEIVMIEQADPERSWALEKNCDKLINFTSTHKHCTHLFHCGTGNGSCTVSYGGFFRLCSSLWHPDCIYDLKRGTLKDAYQKFALRVRDMRSENQSFLARCKQCSIINLCMWCPAHAYLETGQLDTPVEYFCEVAHARAGALAKVKA